MREVDSFSFKRFPTPDQEQVLGEIVYSALAVDNQDCGWRLSGHCHGVADRRIILAGELDIEF